MIEFLGVICMWLVLGGIGSLIGAHTDVVLAKLNYQHQDYMWCFILGSILGPLTFVVCIFLYIKTCIYKLYDLNDD